MTSAGLELCRYVDAEHERKNSEEDLRTRLAEGSLAAVGEAYDRYHTHVRALGQRLIGERESVEDLVQEVFVALPRAIRRDRREATLKTFILSIAVNCSRHHVRSAVRRRTALGRLASMPPADSTDPERHVGQLELADLLVELLDDLPHDQRVAFVLSDVEERSSPEIAAIVGVPEATVRTRLFHARRKLREALERKGVSP